MMNSFLLPKHVAIIMDGNGRWAELRGKERVFGHVAGTNVAKNIIEESARIGIEYLTLYAFSSENWSRPKTEVSFLMKLLLKYIKKERNNLHKNNIKFKCVGQRNRLSKLIQDEIESSENLTRNNTGMLLTFCLSYGGRQEITTAVQKICSDVEKGVISASEVDESTISTALSTSPSPDPDLLIRTSGEQRLSNFLPWQLIYTELYFTNTFWPDFDADSFREALEFYCQRNRRFGNLDEKGAKLSTPSSSSALPNNL